MNFAFKQYVILTFNLYTLYRSLLVSCLHTFFHNINYITKLVKKYIIVTLFIFKSSFSLLQCWQFEAQRDHEHCSTFHTKDGRSEDAARYSEPGFQQCCYPWLQNLCCPTRMKEWNRKSEPCTWATDCEMLMFFLIIGNMNMKLYIF